MKCKNDRCYELTLSGLYCVKHRNTQPKPLPGDVVTPEPTVFVEADEGFGDHEARETLRSQPPVLQVPGRIIGVKDLGGDLGRVIEYTPDHATGFVKHDGDKPQFDLIPPEVELEVAKAFTHGAKKYSANNYRKGTRWGRYVAATRRHMNAWQLGETTDPDSGLSHLAHAIASLMMLQTLQITGVGEDDRVPLGKRGAK